MSYFEFSLFLLFCRSVVICVDSHVISIGFQIGTKDMSVSGSL